LPDQRRSQCCDALLSIDEDFLTKSSSSIFCSRIRISPGDEIADRKTLIEGIHQISNLGRVPDKRPLDLWNRDFSGADGRENRFDEVLINGVFLLFHFVCLAEGSSQSVAPWSRSRS